MSKRDEAVAARRSRILDAATSLFLQQGFKAVSMEAIAAATPVAKPTLYKHFPDKEAVFVAIVQRLIAELRAGVAAALGGNEDGAVRIARALTFKHRKVQGLLAKSAFGDELFGAQNRLAGQDFVRFERWLDDEVRLAAARGGYRDAMRVAPVLVAASDGIARRLGANEDIGPAVWLLVEGLLHRA